MKLKIFFSLFLPLSLSPLLYTNNATLPEILRISKNIFYSIAFAANTIKMPTEAIPTLGLML